MNGISDDELTIMIMELSVTPLTTQPNMHLWMLVSCHSNQKCQYNVIYMTLN